MSLPYLLMSSESHDLSREKAKQFPCATLASIIAVASVFGAQGALHADYGCFVDLLSSFTPKQIICIGLYGTIIYITRFLA
jgi:hypothetical protein